MIDIAEVWDAKVNIKKYSVAQTQQATAALGRDPLAVDLAAMFSSPEDGELDVPGNILVTVGLNLLTELLEGGGGTPFAHADAIVGVGAGVTAAAIGDTALTDDNSANAYYQQADSGNPTQSGGVITCVCTFASGNANFAWQEWCLATGSGGITAGTHLSAVATSVTMLNHKVQSLGTKASGAAWVLTAVVTIA